MYYHSIFKDLVKLNRELSGIYSGSYEKAYAQPRANLYENTKEYTLLLRVPGYKKEDITISYKDKVLTVSGEKKEEQKKEARYHIKERNNGPFERAVRLHDKIDSGAIEAQLENGILRITLPKAPEAQPKTIEIN